MSEIPAEIKDSRRHDLDALRAFAMLLGIVLHAVLSLTGKPWIVMDRYPTPALEWMNHAIHGFRMPLFIFLSGYFTMMLWRQRGLKSLLWQRYLRVLIPCLLGAMTIVPALRMSVSVASTMAAKQDAKRADTTPKSPLVEAIRRQNKTEVDQLLVAGTDVSQPDPEFGIPPLSWAAHYGDLEIARRLIAQGADVNQKNRDGYRALHSAAFLGFPDVVELLLEHGADPAALGKSNDTASDSAAADWGTTKFIAQLLRIPLREEAEIWAGRAQCRNLIIPLLPAATDPPAAVDGQNPKGSAPAKPTEAWNLNQLRRDYVKFQTSEQFLLRVPNRGLPQWLTDISPLFSLVSSPKEKPIQLIFTSFFDHLWFLWFLCYLVVIFTVCVTVGQWLSIPKLPRQLILSPFGLIWIIGFTMIPQLFMGSFNPTYGPDTSTGLIMPPHLLAYYGIFFGVGTCYYDADDQQGKVGRWWPLTIPLSLLVLLPLGHFTLGQIVISGLFQVTYTWLMTFGLMGLFRSQILSENKRIRYLADSAYWLYLAHLPLIVLAQGWMRDWNWPAPLKLPLIVVLVTGLLLLSYQYLVRYTWIGRMLNGPRTRS